MTTTQKKYNQKKFKKVIFFNIVFRLLTGPILFASAWLACLINFSLDWADGEFFKRAGWTQKKYTLLDKTLDFYWYLFILAYVFYFNLPSKEIFLGLFLFRTLGQFLFFLTKKGLLFFLFPNLFEIFFFFYLLTTFVPSLKPFMHFPKAIYPLAVITIIVLIREYILHIKKANLSWFFTGKTTYWVDEKQ